MAAAEEDMGGGGPFKLSYELRAHEDDVRGVCACVGGEGGEAIATASRDKTVRYWAPASTEGGGNRYELKSTFVGHTSFVGPVAWMPSQLNASRFPAGALVSGGMDTRVLVWDVVSGALAQELAGHELQVSSVAILPNGDIVSASLDKTIRVWREGACIGVLTGHEGPVLAVLALPNGQILSGGADKTIRLWEGSKCVRTFTGHSDSVRGLSLVPDVGVLSASHDGTVRLWSFQGDVVMELVGHTALVYAAAANTMDGTVASASEDNTVRVWRGGECVQTIPHPGCVWGVVFLSNGDLATACSDSVARIWTTSADRAADDQTVALFAAAILARQTASKTVGGVPVSELPGLEALQQPGTKDGQTKIIKEGDSGVAYSWNSREFNWDKVGEVIDGPDDGGFGSRSLHGVTYDYVFDVDIGDGQPVRKLPYNRGDNPYTAAAKFLEDEDLPMTYRDQVVEFINTNTQAAAPQYDVPANFDPFTGGGAYVPSGSSHTSTTSKSQTSFTHIPKKGFLFFDTAQFDAIERKIMEFNASTPVAEAGAALSEEHVALIKRIIATARETTRYHVSKFSDAEYAVLDRMLLSWPHAQLFPVLDTLRMLLMHPEAAARYSRGPVLLQALLRASGPPVMAAAQLTALRALANAYRHRALRDWLRHSSGQVIDAYAECCRSDNKNIRLALATVLLNYAVLASEGMDAGPKMHCLSALMQLCADEDPQVLFRALAGAGTLVCLDPSLRDQAQSLGLQAAVDSAKTSATSTVVECAKDVSRALQQT
eukprot:jgi/Chlat1/2682/Chrsp18S02992